MEREIKKQRSEANNKFCHVKKKIISCFHIINLVIIIYIYIYINWFNLSIQNSSISSCSLWHSKSYKIDSLCKKSCSENSRNFSHRRISYKNEEDHLDTSLWQSDQLHWQDLPGADLKASDPKIWVGKRNLQGFIHADWRNLWFLRTSTWRQKILRDC